MSGTNSLLEIKNLSKLFHGPAGSRIHVLDGINFTIDSTGNDGRLTSILSPAGAGKTTLLKIISALEKPSSGEVILKERKYLKPDGSIVYIPENASSFPWLSVSQNIEFALSLKGISKEEVKKRKDELISLVGLSGYGNHYPHDKSSGFRFRISLARALAIQPEIILLDDCFKNLHSETKKELHNLIKSIRLKLSVIFILATSNITEAVELSGNILLLKKHPGKVFRQINVIEFNKSHHSEDNNLSLKSEIEKSFENADERMNIF
ncbi:MAG: ABC transporter ATP-binding protein [Ignavibacteriaceae bacterium]